MAEVNRTIAGELGVAEVNRAAGEPGEDEVDRTIAVELDASEVDRTTAGELDAAEVDRAAEEPGEAEV